MENDKSGNLSLEKTASTVEIASTTIERTTSKAVPSATGRTAWDALVDMGGMLGRYTPWIIMVAGVAYGVYKFTDLEQRAQAEAKKEFQKDIDQGHKELKDTYKQIGEMHAQQLTNLMSMLKLNDQTAQNTQQKQTELKKLQDETEKTKLEVEEAKKAVDKAKAEALLAEKEKAEAQNQRKSADDGLRKQQREVRDKKQELSRQEKAIKQRTIHITELRDKMVDLAKNLVNSTDPSVVTLGQEILKDSLLEAHNLLAAYAKRPGKVTAEALQVLVGSKEEPLEAALAKGLGFAFWQKYSMKDGSKTAYVGAVRQTFETDEGVVMLLIREKKLQSVDVFPLILSVALWDPDDWNKAVACNLYLRPTGEAGIDRFDIKGGFWTVPDTETDFLDQGPPKVLFGTEKPLSFMNLNDFKEKHPDIFKAASESNRERFSNMVEMLANEKGFNPNKIAEPFVQLMPKGLRGAFVQLLTESVQRTPVKAVPIASTSNLKPEVYGSIAATVLKPGFKIGEVGPSSASTVSPGRGETCVILSEYHPIDEGVKHARLTFTRDGPDDKWMLLNFEQSVALSLTGAE
jgi:hypothetical protein